MSALTNIRDYIVSKASEPKPLRALRSDVEFAIDTGRVLINEIQLIGNPQRTELLFDLFEVARKHKDRFAPKLQSFLDAVYEDEELVAMYEERYDPPRPDVDILRTLPDGTLGREFARFLDDNELDANFYPHVEERFADRFEFLEARAREVHDVWHVITGVATDIPDEIALQMFTFQQLRLPGTVLLISGGLQHLMFFKPEQISEAMEKMNAAWNGGVDCRPLLSFKHENHWARSLAEVRQLVGISQHGIMAKGKNHE